MLTLLKGKDHNVALGRGQPFLLHLKNCDISPLVEADFYESDDWERDFKHLVQKQLPCHIHASIKYVQLATASKSPLSYYKKTLINTRQRKICY